MIPNLVTHVRREIDKGLKLFFDDSYIISVVLEDIEDDVRASFTNRYVNSYDSNGQRTKDGVKIPVLTTYPENLNNADTFILVGMGSSKEDIDHIGMSGGGYNNDDSPIVKEVNCRLIKLDDTTLGVYLNHEPDIDTVVIPSISSNDVYYDSKGYLVLKNLPKRLISTIDEDSDTLQVNYAPLVKKDSPAMGYGFVVEETATVSIISKNMDDIRALDAIIKALIIIIRKKEFSKYNLGRFEAQAPLPLEDYAPGTPGMLFAREFDLDYKVDYLIDNANKQRLDKIAIQIVGNSEK